ncbi:hypothetical protein DERP_007278 [Dermatophagoides pteronyssinus]|uniref:Uncharacterized protein n=2 Tax=Dermatophagoides pteronyssinus TaxID=6956 RepID=A0ABQ8J488_DERPT|nr:methyltransferase-like 26 [Dermatophagoides pteronyssinus]KAH9417281.1 hypothetical protein DERP_007278 [Dermatophagoides pteronyssinus]
MASKILRPTIYAIPERNKEPILNVLKQIFQQRFDYKLSSSDDDDNGDDGKSSSMLLKFLEIGSCSGQHLAHFARNFPNIEFQPSDIGTSNLFDSIEAFRQGLGFEPPEKPLKNICKPIEVDLTSSIEQWPIQPNSYDIIYCSNVVHISPWSCSIGLFTGAKYCLKKPNGLLIMYGPFALNGKLEPQSNRDFDQSLRQRNQEWGIRDICELEKLAEQNGLILDQTFDMPANNKILLFKFKND